MLGLAIKTKFISTVSKTSKQVVKRFFAYENNLERVPQQDAYVSVPKSLAPVEKDLSQMRDAFEEKLHKFMDKDGEKIFGYKEIVEFIDTSDTVEKLEAKDYLISSLAKFRKKYSENELHTDSIRDIAETTDTMEKAKTKLFLTSKLLPLNNMGKRPFFDTFDLSDIVKLVDTMDIAEFKADYAHNLSSLLDSNKQPMVEKIANLVEEVSSKEEADLKFAFAKQLSELKNSRGIALFNPFDLYNLVSHTDSFEVAQARGYFATNLAEIKDIHNQPLFDSFFLNEDLIKMTKSMDVAQYRLDAANLMAKSKYKDDEAGFNDDRVAKVLRRIRDEEKLTMLKIILSATDSEGYSAFHPNNIINMLDVANTPDATRYTSSLIANLLSTKSNSGKQMLTFPDMELLIRSVDSEEKVQLEVKTLKRIAAFFDDVEIDSACVNEVISSVKNDEESVIKADWLKNIALVADTQGKPRFSPFVLSELVKSFDSENVAQLRGNYAIHLSDFKSSGGEYIFTANSIGRLAKKVKTPEDMLAQSYLIDKLKVIEDVFGDCKFDSDQIEYMALKPYTLEQFISESIYSTKPLTMEQAIFKSDLASHLLKIKEKNKVFDRLASSEIIKIVVSADTLESAEAKKVLSVDEDFINKIDTLDKAFGAKLYYYTLLLGEKLDITKFDDLYKFLSENKIKLQKHGSEKVTNNSIIELFEPHLIKATDMVDNSVIKYATKLKYAEFKEFIENVSSLGKYKKQIKEHLSKLSTPDMKFDRLQSIIALKKADCLDSNVITQAITLIDSTSVTNEQIAAAKRIFSSEKPYEEQISEFMKEFNISPKYQGKFFEFFKPKSESEQIMIVDKQIQAVKNLPGKTEAQKQAYLKAFEYKKKEIISNPLESGKFKPNNSSLKQLASKIETYVNIVEQDNKFNTYLNSVMYSAIDLNPSKALQEKLNFDMQYFSDLFNTTYDKDFQKQFKNLIDLLESDVTKPLSELRETLSHNNETKEFFEKFNLNYKKWTSYDESLKLPFSCDVDVEEAAKSVERNIANELTSELFASVDKKETDKILMALLDADYQVEDNKLFKNGHEIVQKDLVKIVDIIKDTINKNSQFWDKPLADSKKEALKNELADHFLRGRRKEVSDLMSITNAKMDLFVRLSNDDDVGRNIFLGNHVGCCTSVSGSNGFAAPQHLMNSFVRAVEIVDKSGSSYGNSMCYFARVNDKLSFVIDSFEANGKLGGNPAVTNAIIDYAKMVTKEMGASDIPIYFGPNFNKISMEPLKKIRDRKIEIIGRVQDTTYIDTIGGRRDVNTSTSVSTLYAAQ